MEPWYKIAQPRQEVSEGRSFNPDEFAIALEQVVAQTAPEDYRDATKFFSRTVFTRALKDHVGLVLRRLAGHTQQTAPVLTLVTQFGGGKTHTLTALYHLVENRQVAGGDSGVKALLREAGLPSLPKGRVAVFVGNAWDPQPGRDTPWLDLARQLAGDAGVEALGPSALTVPPGTEALSRLFAAAGGSVLILCDEVLNFINRHRNMAEPFHAFVQNLTVAMTGTSRGAAVISLPRSQVEMTDFDQEWQERITKVVRRVAKDLIANDESEISEVIRRRLFEDVGRDSVRRAVARTFADWCFDRRAQLPAEWTAVDAALTESKARDQLRARFEACYPFHPATLSVFQRKWQTVPQYQQTRGTLAMLAQWISWAGRDQFQRARREPLITLGSSPLQVPEFRATVLGQLGESRLIHAIEADIVGEDSHARSLDADTHGALRDIHRRVGATILFESSGGMVDKVAHLPELRVALGGPDVDTTSIDNAAFALENKGYYLRRVGTDGFRFGFKPTLKKVVNDRRASLDDREEVPKEMRSLVQREFDRGASVMPIPFPADSSLIPDTTRLTLVVMDPDVVWDDRGALRETLSQWTRQRGRSPRLYPGALVFCVNKPGRDLQDKVETYLAWKRVADEIAAGTLGGEFEPAERQQVHTNVRDAHQAAKDEVWAGYRYVLVYDPGELAGLRLVDLGAGHASAAQTLYGRVVTALKVEGLLNESVGAGYIERNWPAAFRESGAWPLSGLRQAFLNSALIRLTDPDRVLKEQIVRFVGQGDFGLAAGQRPDGTHDRLWFNESVAPEEVAFDDHTFLLHRQRVEALRRPVDFTPPPSTPWPFPPGGVPTGPPGGELTLKERPEQGDREPLPTPGIAIIRLEGSIPPEVWNRIGIRLLPKLRAGQNLTLEMHAAVEVSPTDALHLEQDIRAALSDLGIQDTVRVERSEE